MLSSGVCLGSLIKLKKGRDENVCLKLSGGQCCVEFKAQRKF